MSAPESPAPTEAQQILTAIENLSFKFDQVIAGLNNVGTNQQWMIDQAKGVFQMFSSPQFMNQILSGGIPGVGANAGESGQPGESGQSAGGAD